MPRARSALLGVLFVAGCAQQVRVGADQSRSTIPQILADQALNNAAQAYHDPMAVPAQIRLINSVTNATNGVNAGIFPDIALRAIAITGFNLSTSSSISQNWSSNPISGYLDLKLLQMFYSYAVEPKPDANGYVPPRESFDHFESELDKVVAYKPPPAADDGGDGKKKTPPNPKPPPLSTQIGRLPDSGFIRVNDPNRCAGGVQEFVLYTNVGDRVCFLPNQNTCKPGQADCRDIDPNALRSLFILWSVAIPDLSSPNDQPQRGSSPKGANGLVITVPAAPTP
jgi:hypothetical protein